jgi:deoxyribodipyrimidine photolyase-related protein
LLENFSDLRTYKKTCGVKVPNVYGMTQFVDGGTMITNPYISGSNYLLKMSDYPKGGWTEI